MFLYVFLRVMVGRTMNPINEGLFPRCVTLLKIATLVVFSIDFVAIKLADLYPVHELIKFNFSILSICEMVSFEMVFMFFVFKQI